MQAVAVLEACIGWWFLCFFSSWSTTLLLRGLLLHIHWDTLPCILRSTLTSKCQSLHCLMPVATNQEWVIVTSAPLHSCYVSPWASSLLLAYRPVPAGWLSGCEQQVISIEADRKCNRHRKTKTMTFSPACMSYASGLGLLLQLARKSRIRVSIGLSCWALAGLLAACLSLRYLCLSMDGGLQVVHPRGPLARTQLNRIGLQYGNAADT